MSFIELLCLFALYSVFGWCTEVIYATMNTGKFVNRGFLNGPVCPIYGTGVVIVVLILDPISNSLPLLFLGAVVLTSVLEFITGAVLERFFHLKWWDYSDEHFNIKGYVCLKFSVLWGLACILVVRILQPPVMKFIRILPVSLRTILLVIFYSLLVFDLIITVVSLMKLQKQLRLLTEIEKTLNGLSETVGETLSKGTIKGMQEIRELKEQTEKVKEETTDYVDAKKLKLLERNHAVKERLEYLKERYTQSLAGKSFVHRRINLAFPKLNIPTRAELLQRLEEWKKSNHGSDK